MFCIHVLLRRNKHVTVCDGSRIIIMKVNSRYISRITAVMAEQ